MTPRTAPPRSIAWWRSSKGGAGASRQLPAFLRSIRTELPGNMPAVSPTKWSGHTVSTRAMRFSPQMVAAKPVPMSHLTSCRPSASLPASSRVSCRRPSKRCSLPARQSSFGLAHLFAPALSGRRRQTDGRQPSPTCIRSLCPHYLSGWQARPYSSVLAGGTGAGSFDPPRQVAEALLARKGLWSVPRVSGVITTPTLRSDGSPLADKGYDVATGLYLSLGLDELTMPMPTREAAQTGLKLLTDLLAEFSFAEPRDRSVAISGLLTTLVRGSLPTAPMYLVRAHTPVPGRAT